MDATPGDAHPGPMDVHVWRYPSRDTASASALRAILGGYLGAPPLDIEISTGPKGKPALASSASGLHFNVSHSGDWGLIAIARSDVGVDVEQVRPTRASERLADRFLTAGERSLLESRVVSHGDTGFFMIWSRKEAYLKAVGVGLSGPFSGVDSSLDNLPELDADGHQQEGSSPWIVREFFVDYRHPAAVVLRARQISLSCFTFDGFHA